MSKRLGGAWPLAKISPLQSKDCSAVNISVYLCDWRWCFAVSCAYRTLSPEVKETPKCCKLSPFLKSNVCLSCWMNSVLSEAVFLCLFWYTVEINSSSLTHKYAIYWWIEFQTLFYQHWFLPGEMIPIYQSLREKKAKSGWIFQSRIKKWALEFMTNKSNL